MPATVKVKYFNTFILRKDNSAAPAASKGWHIEESRIKGAFNGKSVSFGVKAYATNERYARLQRENAIIYSGVINSRTDVNETNQFSSGEKITRAVDKNNGSIQKLYAEDTNLIIFQERKVSQALIDKDAIYTAEGTGLTSTGKQVIGQVVSYAGEWGISKVPESFAVHGTRKYFVDTNSGDVLRLSRDGVTPISSYGMRDFFRDNLKNATRTGNKIVGYWDNHHDKYVISIQEDSVLNSATNRPTAGSFSTIDAGNTFQAPLVSDPTETADAGGIFCTVGFDDSVKGWVSFYGFMPSFAGSLDNEVYSFNAYKGGFSGQDIGFDLYKHYTSSDYNKFYEEGLANSEFEQVSKSFVTTIFNESPIQTKNFNTISYTGTDYWKVNSITTDIVNSQDTEPGAVMQIEAYPSGQYANPITGNVEFSGFNKKDGGYYANIVNSSGFSQPYDTGVVLERVSVTGVKGKTAKVRFETKTDTADIRQTFKELFTVGTEVI